MDQKKEKAHVRRNVPNTKIKRKTVRPIAPVFTLSTNTVVPSVRRDAPEPLPPPTSTVDRLRAEYVRRVSDLRLDHLPSLQYAHMMGTARSLDYAAEYLIKMATNTGPGATGLVLSPWILDSYCKAVYHMNQELRHMSGDALGPSLVAANMLSHLDTMSLDPAHERITAAFMHRAGWSTIVRTQEGLTDLGMSIVFADGGTFVNAVFTGSKSPFDVPHWLAVEPPERKDDLWQLRELQKITMRLFVRLPGLICLIRQSQSGVDPIAYMNARETAAELMQLRDDAAETWLLHRVRIVPTTDQDDRSLISHSYSFVTLDELGYAVKYWTSRLLTVTLQKILMAGDTNNPGVTTDVENLTRQQDRLVANVLMCWQQAFDNRPGGTVYMTVGFLCTWAALRDRKTFRGQAITYLGHRLCHHLTRAHGGAGAGQTLDRLDLTAVVLVGGPLPSLIARRTSDTGTGGQVAVQKADRDMHKWLTAFVVACATNTAGSQAR
jgi:hypothetical protein